MKKKVVLPEVLFGETITSEDVFNNLQSCFLAEVERRLKAKKMSKSQLAMRMGISRSAISKLLNTENNLSLQKISEIATALQIKIDFCFGEYKRQNKASYSFEIKEKE